MMKRDLNLALWKVCNLTRYALYPWPVLVSTHYMPGTENYHDPGLCLKNYITYWLWDFEPQRDYTVCPISLSAKWGH